MYLIFQQHKKKKIQETQKSMLKCLNYGSRCVFFKFTNSSFDLDNDKDVYIIYVWYIHKCNLIYRNVITHEIYINFD